VNADDPIYPDVDRLLAERRELIRRCAVRALKLNVGDAETQAWARHVVATVPELDGELSDGVMND
jgi:hypothetical protein